MSLCSLLLSLEAPNDVQSVAYNSHTHSSKISDQTARMRRLVCVFAGRPHHIVGYSHVATHCCDLSITQDGLRCWKNGIYNNGPQREKTCLRGFSNNTGAYQPAQTDQRLCYSLFGKYHVNLVQVNFQFFYLISVAEETGLKIALSITRQIFSRRGPFTLLMIQDSGKQSRALWSSW